MEIATWEQVVAGIFTLGVLSLGRFWDRRMASRAERHELRMAAVDKRLEVHQEAFALWVRLRRAFKVHEVDAVRADIDSWWSTNCLYLCTDVARAFATVPAQAKVRAEILGTEGKRTESQLRTVQEVARKIDSMGDMIRAAVYLPPLGSKTPEDEEEHSAS